MEVSREQIRLHSALRARSLHCTVRAECAYHDRQWLSGVSVVSAARRKAAPALWKSRVLARAITSYHIPL